MNNELLEKLKQIKELIKELIKECEDKSDEVQAQDDTTNPDPPPPKHP